MLTPMSPELTGRWVSGNAKSPGWDLIPSHPWLT